MAAKKRTTGLTDVHGICFDVTKPTVIAHFQSKDSVDRVEMWFPILHKGQDTFKAEYPVEGVFQHALAVLGRIPVSKGEWRGEYRNPITLLVNDPQFRNAEAEHPIAFYFNGTAELVDGKMQIDLSGIRQGPPHVRPSGVCIWLERL